MEFVVGDRIILNESAIRYAIDYGYSKKYVELIYEVTKVKHNYSYIVNIRTNITDTIPNEVSYHYRLATYSEIKRDKIKKIFIQ